MKKYIAFITTLSFAVGILSSCHDKPELIATTSAPDGVAYVKVGDFAPNFRTVFGNKPDSFNVFVNNQKISGSYLSYGGLYPTTTNLYAAVPAGAVTIKMTQGITNPDSVTLISLNKTLTAGAYYSLLVTDSVQTAGEPKQIFVQDNFSRVDTLHYMLRFAHTILTDTAGKNVDVWSQRLKTNIFSNIAPGTVTAFTTQPYFYVADTFSVRRAGTTNELTKLSTLALPIGRERAYTLVYKGTSDAASTKPRSLVYYNNQ